MLIELLDPSGTGLGLAIGLRQLGHDVIYTEAHSRPRSAVGGVGTMDRMREEVVGRTLETTATSCVAARGRSADLLVIVDVFGDYLHCLETGVGDPGEAEAVDPMQANAGVPVYPLRLRHFVERAQDASRVAVVDMSDRRGVREGLFEQIPQASLFAREAAGAGEGAWRPFPFLYNLAMLWIELVQSGHDELVASRDCELDWVFCGTLHHERYGGRRLEQMDEVARRWPGQRGAVFGDRSFGECVARLRSARFGLDLAGSGDLCFRLHECLALGVPVWQPFASAVQLPAGLASVVVADPGQGPCPDAAFVREVYAEHYAPIAAARWLLDGCGLSGSAIGSQSATQPALRRSRAGRAGTSAAR